MSEPYEIATFFDLQNHPAGSHKITIDNYGQGKYMLDGRDVSHVVKSHQPYTKPLSPCLIRFIQAANESVKTSNMVYCDRSPSINHQFIKDLYLLQDVQKEIEQEIDRKVKEKVAEFEADYERRIKLFKEDFQAEIDQARKILQTNVIKEKINQEATLPPFSPIASKKCSLGVGCGGEGDARTIPSCSCYLSTICKTCDLDFKHTSNCKKDEEKWDAAQECWTDGKNAICGSNAPNPNNYNSQEELVKAWQKTGTCRKCKHQAIINNVKHCSCAYKECCDACRVGGYHASFCQLEYEV